MEYGLGGALAFLCGVISARWARFLIPAPSAASAQPKFIAVLN
jgi:hypothetical protein